MAKTNDIVFCDGCGVEITWSPVLKGHEKYCCIDGRDGRECNCAERMELDEDRRGSGNDALAPD